MLTLYKWLISAARPLLIHMLNQRVKAGKEEPARLQERCGQATKSRPPAPLIWLHAASVGESQSALILINHLLECCPGLYILVTTGTKTSAELMEQKLPARTIHQYAPLDHPAWVKSFIDYWTPDAVLWMESELWPNMITELKRRGISLALINARLSPRSYQHWCLAKGLAKEVLSAFELLLCQSDIGAERFRALGASNVHVTDNLKFSASPLPCDQKKLQELQDTTQARPLCLYASTHDAEEAMACRVHQRLEDQHANLLSIIVPRHPARGDEIYNLCTQQGLRTLRRSAGDLPQTDTQIYIADTLGELGLFYTLCPIAFIGRSLSADGGGGHNPIEAAQLDCAVLHGPHVQFQKYLFGEMADMDAATQTDDEDALYRVLDELLCTPATIKTHQDAARAFAQNKEQVILRVLDHLSPFLQDTGIQEHVR